MTQRVPRLATLCCLLLAAGCGRTPRVHDTTAVDDSPEARMHELNARARRGAVTETLHGQRVEDPYRSLEEDSPATAAWVEAQTLRTEQALAAYDDPARDARIDALLSIGSIDGAQVGGARVFYRKREGDAEQPMLFVREGDASRMLLDPSQLGEHAAMDWYFASPGGRYVAYGVSEAGSERSVLHLLDVDSGETLGDSIERTKWSQISWLHDEAGFYYTRYPAPGEAGYDAEHPDAYFPRVYFHLIGRPSADDPMVFEAEEGAHFPGASVGEDDRYVVLTTFRGWSASDVRVFDRGEDPSTRVAAPDDDHPLRDVIVGEEHVTVGRVADGELLLYTNKDAPRYRIAKVGLGGALGPDAWTEVVPQSEGKIDGWELSHGELLLTLIDDVHSRIVRYDLLGHALGEIILPALGSVSSASGTADSDIFAFSFSSPLTPPSLYLVDLTTPAPGASNDSQGATTPPTNAAAVLVDQVESDVDTSAFVVETVHVTSEDGTEIPLRLIHRRDLQRDGDNPALLYGYGGFDVSLLPEFTRSALYWVERGGVYAVGNLRGGGEFGEDWHRAGDLENKHHVFEDFEAAIRFLSTSGISRPERIAITGGSNGGLLMGAMITRVPESFRAAASYVGLYDMLRYDRFPPAQLWIPEYGTAADAAQFLYLYAYSPYHHIVQGVAYPAVLIETAENDSRVFWGHSTKFAARLEEATSSTRPIYFYMERAQGHGAGTRRSDLVRRYARMYGFLEHELGMTSP
ncbi:MAG: S9 family peptidase [Deltaproteobacteria bacterium]|nr:S9 family peptidase [Deltaproteobacteria bacterium]